VVGTHMKIDDMIWPKPCKKMEELQWRLRYAPQRGRGDDLLAASIICAYIDLIGKTVKDREYIVRKIKAHRKPSTCGSPAKEG